MEKKFDPWKPFEQLMFGPFKNNEKENKKFSDNCFYIDVKVKDIIRLVNSRG